MEYTFIPHKAQLQVMKARKRFKVIACGRRWGKTTLSINQLILEALANQKGGEYWYLAPTYRQAKSIAWRMLKDKWNQLPKSLQTDKNEAELWVEIAKSRISLKGADNEDSLRGSGLHGLILDEVPTYRNWVYLWENVLRPALSDYKGFAWFIGTPKGFNHFHQLFYEYEQDEDFVSFQFPSSTNPFLSAEEIEKARVELTEDAFAQEYLADFRKFTGLIYKEFDRNIHVIDPIQIAPFWRFYRAMDFGAVNPTVCLWIAADNSDNFYVFDEYFKDGQTSKFHAEVIKAKTPQNIIVVTTWGDPSAEQEQIDYAQYGLIITPALRIVPPGKDWVNSGIEKVRELLKPHPQTGRARLYIFRNCQNLIREFESYHWLEAKNELNSREMPEKKDDHCMDALRYFVVSYSAQPQDQLDPWGEPLRQEANKFTGY